MWAAAHPCGAGYGELPPSSSLQLHPCFAARPSPKHHSPLLCIAQLERVGFVFDGKEEQKKGMAEKSAKAFEENFAKYTKWLPCPPPPERLPPSGPEHQPPVLPLRAPPCPPP